MQCQRLKNLIRDWYQEVRNFTLSPIKMIELINKHIKICEICQKDKDLPLELDQLREIIRVPHNLSSSEKLRSSIQEEYLYEEETEEIEEEY
ncbi:MAG: hypothetical protein J7K20_05330 [Thermodesulfobacterium sp.]|nr:hypothetical protein [Thermodesulfobacterium sp.]